MKREKTYLNFGNKRISVEAEVMTGLWRAIGLMFSQRGRAKVLIFKFEKPARMAIHSLFVFFPFIAVWTGTDGKVMKIQKVKPFSWYICPPKKFISLVEIPLNRKYKKITDGIERFK